MMDPEICEGYKIELQLPVCQVGEYCPYQLSPGFTFEGESFKICGKAIKESPGKVFSRLPVVKVGMLEEVVN